MWIVYFILPILIIFTLGVRVVKKNHRGCIERLGRRKKLIGPGVYWIIPVAEKIFLIDLSDQQTINLKLSNRALRKSKV